MIKERIFYIVKIFFDAKELSEKLMKILNANNSTINIFSFNFSLIDKFNTLYALAIAGVFVWTLCSLWIPLLMIHIELVESTVYNIQQFYFLIF